MFSFKINKRGELYYKAMKKEVWRFLIYSPIILSFTGFLFVIGAKDKDHLILSYFLLAFFAVLFVISTYRLNIIINRTIKKIVFLNSKVKISSMKALGLSPKRLEVDISNIEFISTIFKINRKRTEPGWIVKIKNSEIEFRLYNTFFNEELEIKMKEFEI